MDHDFGHAVFFMCLLWHLYYPEIYISPAWNSCCLSSIKVCFCIVTLMWSSQWNKKNRIIIQPHVVIITITLYVVILRLYINPFLKNPLQYNCDNCELCSVWHAVSISRPFEILDKRFTRGLPLAIWFCCQPRAASFSPQIYCTSFWLLKDL